MEKDETIVNKLTDKTSPTTSQTNYLAGLKGEELDREKYFQYRESFLNLYRNV